MANRIKLRRVGNSLGTTFSRELLTSAGLVGDEDFEVVTSLGEIRLRRVSPAVVVELSVDEAGALVAGEVGTKAAKSAREKLGHALAEKRGSDES